MTKGASLREGRETVHTLAREQSAHVVESFEQMDEWEGVDPPRAQHAALAQKPLECYQGPGACWMWVLCRTSGCCEGLKKYPIEVLDVSTAAEALLRNPCALVHFRQLPRFLHPATTLVHSRDHGAARHKIGDANA